MANGNGGADPFAVYDNLDSYGPASTLNNQSATGSNDTSSPWLSGLVKDVTGLGGTAAGILGALRGTAKPTATTASKLPTWLLPVAIAGVVVLILLMLVKK